jgi:predicted membrane metal-binding protein
LDSAHAHPATHQFLSFVGNGCLFCPGSVVAATAAILHQYPPISLRTTRTASIILVLLSIIGMLYFKTYLHIIAFLIVTGMPLIASMILACAPEDNDGTSLQTGNGTQLASHA